MFPAAGILLVAVELSQVKSGGTGQTRELATEVQIAEGQTKVLGGGGSPEEDYSYSLTAEPAPAGSALLKVTFLERGETVSEQRVMVTLGQSAAVESRGGGDLTMLKVTPREAQTKMLVYHLEHVGTKAAAVATQALLGKDRELDPRVKIEGDEAAHALVVTATSEALSRVKALLQRLDAAP